MCSRSVKNLKNIRPSLDKPKRISYILSGFIYLDTVKKNNHIVMKTTTSDTTIAGWSTVILSLLGVLPLTVIINLLLISLILVG
jgi:hypothetical protein